MSSHVRDLRGVIESEGAVIGVLLTLKDPTKPMQDFAYSSGCFYESKFGHFAKLQMLTIQDLLEGKKIEFPQIFPDSLKTNSPKSLKPEQLHLF
ncbi:MAG TPA: hypothetical protein DEF42_02455 [Desulfosporosinus sp.]|nr:hypothetical protein [Desulfosporosinus sp.]